MKLRISTLYFFLFAVVANQLQHANAQIDGIRSFTEPYRTIELAASEMGTIFEILVEEGDSVIAGSIIAKLDEQVLEKSRAIAADSKQAKGKLHGAQAELRMQEERYLRIKGLLERNHASPNELSRAKGQLEIALAQLETVQDELKIRALELERIDAQIEQRRLRSPINGMVTKIFKDQGEFVSANDPKVATIVQLDPLLVVFLVPQEIARSYRTDQPVDVQIGVERKTVKGMIEYVAPIDAQSGTRRIKVRIENSAYELESGQVCFLNPDIQPNMVNTRKPPRTFQGYAGK